MIIDADVHISPYKKNDRIQVEGLIKLMNYNNVNKAVTWLQPTHNREIANSNQYIYDSMNQYPERILGFGWTDPNLGLDYALKEAKKCLYDYDLYGVKLNGAQNNFFIDDPDISIPIIEEVAKSGKILSLHVGADAIEKTHPFRVAKIADKFPELKILAVHMGGVVKPDLGISMIEFAKEYNNIILVGSKIPPKKVLKAIKILGPDRVCYGSDTPFTLMRVELAKYRALLENEVKEEDINKIMGKNIKNLFAL